jgi:hypothetical protein
LKELRNTGQVIKIGVFNSIILRRQLQTFADQNPSLNIKILPYSGSVHIRAAMVAGDIDLQYSASLRNAFVDKGGVDVAISSHRSEIPVSFLGNLYEESAKKKDVPGFETRQFLASVVGAISPEVKRDLDASLKTPEYLSTMKTLLFMPAGVTIGETQKQELEKIIKYETDFELN